MKLNLNNEFRFSQGTLTSIQSGNVYQFRLEKYDRFYSYIKPYILAGKVSGLTKLMIDTLTIIGTDRTFFNERTFSLNAVLLVKDSNDVFWSFDIAINNIKINQTNVSKLLCEDGNLICQLCELEMPYQTDILISERTE